MYKVWTDSESKVEIKEKTFNNLDDAFDYLVNSVHQYDDKELAIAHIDDVETGEIIETAESFFEYVKY